MADVKISGLPASTVPLAGTEVLPIVQGGVTKKVAVSDLTAGRPIDATTGTFTGLLTSSTGPANVSTLQGGLKSFCPGFPNQYGGILFSTPSASVDQIEADIYTSGNTGVPSSKIKILKDGDVNVLLGNLVIGTSGKGIDFSATAGTGTSELLNDYEEGTWAPNQGAGLTVGGAFTSSGTYTKVGNLVTVVLYLNGATSIAVSAGGVICTNLPFNRSSVSDNTSAGSAQIAAGISPVKCYSTTIYATIAMFGATELTATITYPV